MSRPVRGAPEAFDYLAKICVVGDSGVGKTALLRRYVDDTFDPITGSTIGVDFYLASLRTGGSVVKLQLWDTAGQERFWGIVPTFFRGSHAVLVAFDTTSRASFQSSHGWVARVRAVAPDVAIFLVGTKADAGADRSVDSDEARAAVATLRLAGYFETSARSPAADAEGTLRVFEAAAKVAVGVGKAAALAGDEAQRYCRLPPEQARGERVGCLAALQQALGLKLWG